MNILVPALATGAFLIAAVGWFCAVGLPQSRFSQLWYGKKWSQQDTAAQTHRATRRGILVGSGYLLLGLNAALQVFKAIDPALRSPLSGVQWVVLGAAILCMFGAAIDALRHG